MRKGKNNRKALTKAITWRMISTSTTFLMIYIWFGEWELATGFALVEAVVKFAEYYLHELAWQGKMKSYKPRKF